MPKFYRLHLLGTEYYYQPRSDNNLSKKGKVYTTNNNGFYHGFITIQLQKCGNAYKDCHALLAEHISYDKSYETQYCLPEKLFEKEYIN